MQKKCVFKDVRGSSMRKIVDYSVACGYTRGDFLKEVADLIKSGYQPYGSPFVNRDDLMLQAMVKYEDE